MKKLYALLFITALCHSNVKAQVVFSTNFSNWNDSLPVGWNGSVTSILADSVEEVTTGVVYGTKAMQLIRTASGHKRFSTQPLSVDSGVTYTVEYWAKGSGKIRAGLYSGGSSYVYFSQAGTGSIYDVLTSTLTKYTMTRTAIQTLDTAQFILSVELTGAPNHVIVDSFAITIGSVTPVEVTEVDIYDIQYTTNPSGDSPYKDSVISTMGYVTALDSNSGYWIQDFIGGPYKGVYVFDNSRNPQLGTYVKITGKVIEYFGLTEITNVTGYEVLPVMSPLGVPAPVQVTASELNSEAYEGVLVEITELACTEDDIIEAGQDRGAWELGSSVWVDDNMYFFQPTEGQFYSVIGVVTYAFEEYRILPRNMDDISLATGIAAIDPLNFKVYPNPAIDFVSVEVEESAIANITDLTGKLVSTSLLNKGLNVIELNNLSNGYYTLSILSNGIVSNTALVVSK